MSNTPETDAFYGELHPEQGLREHARSLERRLRETQAELESARTALFSEGARSGAAKAERDAALREALRYRWLADKVIAPDYSDNDTGIPGYIIGHCKGPKVIYGMTLDAAIDAALAEKGKP